MKGLLFKLGIYVIKFLVTRLINHIRKEMQNDSDDKLIKVLKVYKETDINSISKEINNLIKEKEIL